MPIYGAVLEAVFQAGQHHLAPGAGEIIKGLVPLPAFTPAVMDQCQYGLILPCFMEIECDMGELSPHLWQTGRRVPCKGNMTSG